MKLFAFVFILSILFISCSGDNTVLVPEFHETSLLSQSIPLVDSINEKLSGIYSVENGFDNFGRTVVIKWTGNTFAIFTGKNFAYMILKGGALDSTIIMEGYWRYAQDVTNGLVQLKINKDEGGSDVLKGIPVPIILRGIFGEGSENPTTPIVLRYIRPLSQPENPFWIIAHRGGGRNSDALPESENSLGLIKIVEQFGANAVELDVRLTSDNVPILFHDENLSPRLVKGEFCIGPIANYSFAHLRTLCKLKNDEPIPTLQEALETIINNTRLSLVWMDTKVDAAIPALIKLQKEYSQIALSRGRNVEFIIGLPSEEAISAFLAHPLHQTAPVLCELDLDDVRATNATVWAPAWTRGTMTQDVITMHNEGRRVFFWTLDGPEYIRVFLNEGELDGIVTNYPSIVAYEYYTR